MKSVLICAMIVSIVLAVQRETYKVPADILRIMIDQYGKPCAEKHHLDAAVLVAQIANASIPRDDASNEFMYCFARTGGFIEEDGHIVVDRMTDVLEDNHPLKEEMRKAMRKCKEITKENKIQTTIAMNICVVETAPVRLVYEF